MKKIICELCEGTQFIKKDGMFVCQVCGTKYSPEEAKGMMIEVGEDSQSSNSNKFPISLSQRLNNIYAMAAKSYETGNYKQAEEHCSTAIAMDAKQYKIWFLKAKAIGWQSKIQDMRIKEAAYVFSRAIDNAPKKDKDKVKNSAVVELKKMGIALISLRKKRFVVRPSKVELTGFADDRITLLEALMVLLAEGNDVSIPEDYLDEIATIMYKAGVDAFKLARKQWEEIEYPRDTDLLLYIEKINNIEKLIRQAIDASKRDSAEDISRYKFLINVIGEPIGKWSYKAVVDEDNNKIESKDKCISKADVEKREISIGVCRMVVEDIAKTLSIKSDTENEEKDTNDQLWDNYPGEHKRLVSERKSIEAEKDRLKAELESVEVEIEELEDRVTEDAPTEKEKSEVQDQIRDLKNQRANLGIFSGKRRKQIEEELIDLEYRKTMLQNQVDDEMEAKEKRVRKEMAPLKEKRIELAKKIEPLESRISEIDAILERGPKIEKI